MAGFMSSLWSNQAEAQFTVGSSATVTASPELPRPGDTVTLEATSLRSDINKAYFTWTVNGKTIDKGIGKKIFRFQNGKTGTTKAGVFITMEDGEEVSKDFTFSSASVDLIVKADTLVPPFYKGRAFPTYQGDTTVIALPTLFDATGAYLDPNKLIYKWEKDGYIIDSGYGKASIKVEGLMIERPSAIKVTVSSFNDQVHAVGETTISKTSPQIIFYENSPLYGILFNHALSGGATIKNQEVSITAYPYYFSANGSTDSSLTYDWSMNGNKLSENAKTGTVTFKTPATTGQTNLSLRVTNILRELQFSDASLIVNYNQKDNAPTF